MIDIKIMAVGARKEYAEKVAKQVDAQCNIVYDDRGENGGGSAWYNAKRCWLSDGLFSHRLVLQDDIILCNDFMRFVEKCIQFKPFAIWSFYVGHKAEKTFEGQKSDSPFVLVRGCKTSGQAICIPHELIEHIISDTDKVFGESYIHDDSRIGWWCAFNGVQMFTTNPQIVDHMHLKSTLKGHTAARYARTFKQDVSMYNWASHKYSITPIVFPYLWTDKESAVTYTKIAKERVKNANYN